VSRNGQEELQADVREGPEESLHLDALDPDLATLLSPNCLREKQQLNFQNENPFVSMQKHQPFQSPAPPRIFPSSASCHSPILAFSFGFFARRNLSQLSITRSARSQSSPIRTTSSHAYSSLARAAPTRHMPRIMRSVTDRATSVCGDRSVENAARAPSESALPLGDTCRVAIDSTHTGV